MACVKYSPNSLLNLLSSLVTLLSPHPGNIFVLRDGRIGLIDFGQVKQLSGRIRETLCRVMIALGERQDRLHMTKADEEVVGKLSLELGIQMKEGAKQEAAPAVGVWLFDGAAKELPGGYDLGELSPNSPLRDLKSFPEDLVLVGRSCILIKAMSSRLNIPWSLAKEWAPIARNVLQTNTEQNAQRANLERDGRVRFRVVWKTFKQWGKGRTEKVVRSLPSALRSPIAAMILRAEERKTRKKLKVDA